VGLLASCAAPAPTGTDASPTPAVPTPAGPTLAIPAAPPAGTPYARAEEVRFALLEKPSQANVWALLDEAGSSWAERALRSGEYPSLYRLSIPAREVEPYLAEGQAPPLIQEGESWTATLRLKPGLYWSDGSPLNAEDAAYTAATALNFRLGLDWASAYDPQKLASVRAVDARTLFFVVRVPVGVEGWQYGILQGPILSAAYWSPRTAEAEALLPSAELSAQVEKTRSELAAVQALIDTDSTTLRFLSPDSAAYKETASRLNHNQNELNSLNSRTLKLQDEYDAALNAARAALFALPDEDEPVFGPYLRYVQKGNLYTRSINPSYPFEQPPHDRVVYSLYPGQDSGLDALQEGLVDVLLDAEGLTQSALDRLRSDSSVALAANTTRSVRFLVFNPASAPLSDPALRRALSCTLVRGALTVTDALDSFILPGSGDWHNPAVKPSCNDVSDWHTAVETLKDAGYTWSREPSMNEPGQGLIAPGGTPLPDLILLAPSDNEDHARRYEAQRLADAFKWLGLSVDVKEASAEDLRYAVFSTGEYDMALLGWQLSDFPGYLCEWFTAPGPFAFQDAGLENACATLHATTDMETARTAAWRIQDVLMNRLPFLPLYQVLKYEAFRGVSYPFQFTLDGLAGVYGAPWLALPAQ